MRSIFPRAKPFFSPPNMLSLLNLFSGFLSLLAAARGDYLTAAWLIPLAMVWDSLDGNVARIFKMSSQFGRELDSLADVISFVVVPPFLMSQIFSHETSTWLLPMFFLYVGSGTYRLARFNTKPPVTHSFEGLPTPAAAACLSAMILMQLKNQWLSFEQFRFVATFLLMVLSFLMVSKIYYPKLTAVKQAKWKFFYVGVFFLALAAFLVFGIEAAGLAVLFSYLIASPLYAIGTRVIYSKQAKPLEPAARNL